MYVFGVLCFLFSISTINAVTKETYKPSTHQEKPKNPVEGVVTTTLVVTIPTKLPSCLNSPHGFLSYCNFADNPVATRVNIPADDLPDFWNVSARSAVLVESRSGPGFWFDAAQSTLASKLASRVIEKQAKNVIFFLGDGMSVSTVTAARILKGQVVDNVTFGEEAELYFNTFPHTGVSKTFCTDSQVSDSACTSTAYLCGIKANMATLGVTSDVLFGDCGAQMNVSNQVQSILAWAQAAGKSTGIVTTTRLTDASPAGTFGHAANRDWENDAVVRASGIDPNFCDDLSEQLILKEPGRSINVILGGGRKEFHDQSIPDVETGEEGNRRDGKNLTGAWIADKRGRTAEYIYSRDELLRINTTTTDYLLGIFAPNDLAYVESQLEEGDPSLEEMTRVAIAILSKNPNGFFLFVEGGKIDNAHHSNNAKRALMETIEFDKAIKLAGEMTSEEDTVTVVTSDHSHVMTLGGYPARGNPILGIGDYSDRDQLPYTTLSYTNGPGYKPNNPDHTRYNISNDQMEDIRYQQLTAAPTSSETHGGEDVLIFTKGPFGHLLTGVHQQSYIPHVLGYAACIGPGLHYCDNGKAPANKNPYLPQ